MKTSIEIHLVTTKPGSNGAPINVIRPLPQHSYAIRAWVEGPDGRKEYLVTDDRDQLLALIGSAIDRDVTLRSKDWK